MSDHPVIESLVEAALELRRKTGELKFSPPVAFVYNPLAYAWKPHEEYIRRFGGGRKRAVFLGMNPGPFGMAQTGVPFGEVAAVRDWMGIRAAVEKPEREHPRRPVEGWGCPRSEVSGRRLWKLFADRFGTAERFFGEYFVLNYCPLAFVEESGANRTPDKLPPAEAVRLSIPCDAHLRRVLEVLRPEWIVGIGAFAAARARLATQGMAVRTGQILHPSPASPAANRDWPGQATAQLAALGIWPADVS